MTFYDNYSFFICFVVSLIPAVILGIFSKRIAPYGCVVSLFFLVALFWKTPFEGVFCAAFIGFEAAAVLVYMKLKTSGKRDRALFWVVLAFTLLPLVTYKISTIFGGSLLGFVGISYITFKTVQMVLEVHDGLIQDMKPFECLYFLVFFPPFTSGPIDRSRRFIEDMNHPPERSVYLDGLGKGLALIIVGFMYSNAIGAFLNQFNTPLVFSGFASDAWEQELLTSITTAFAYSGYLFFNFAGYSLMAMGVSYCFGIRTPRNFRAPFASVDIKDFWTRWHMTLSFWLRDFVFMRFSRFALKRKFFKSRLTTASCGYLINMTLMGMWHGLTPDFVLYGVYHGILLAITDIFQKKSKFYKKHGKTWWFKTISWAFTMVFVVFGFSIFSGQISTFLGVAS